MDSFCWKMNALLLIWTFIAISAVLAFPTDLKPPPGISKEVVAEIQNEQQDYAKKLKAPKKNRISGFSSVTNIKKPQNNVLNRFNQWAGVLMLPMMMLPMIPMFTGGGGG
jgi:hypothetical protein